MNFDPESGWRGLASVAYLGDARAFLSVVRDGGDEKFTVDTYEKGRTEVWAIAEQGQPG